MVRHNFSVFSFHRRRIISLLPEFDSSLVVCSRLSYGVNTFCPTCLSTMAAKVLPEVLTNTISSTMASSSTMTYHQSEERFLVYRN